MIQLLLIFMRESAIDSSSLVGDGAFDLSSFLFCDARMASVSISVSSHLSHSHRATYLGPGRVRTRTELGPDWDPF